MHNGGESILQRGHKLPLDLLSPARPCQVLAAGLSKGLDQTRQQERHQHDDDVERAQGRECGQNDGNQPQEQSLTGCSARRRRLARAARGLPGQQRPAAVEQQRQQHPQPRDGQK